MAIERSRHRPLACPSGPTRWCNNSRRDTRRPRPRSSGDRAMVSGTMCRRFESFRGRCMSGALTRETPWHFFARPETADVRHRPPGQGVIGRVEEECSRAVANRASVPSSCPLSPGAAAAFEVFTIGIGSWWDADKLILSRSTGPHGVPAVGRWSHHRSRHRRNHACVDADPCV